jgi:hypothetical protein
MIPDAPVRMWQFVDVIVLLILTIGLIALLSGQKREHGKLLPTISQSVARSKRDQIIFTTLMLVCFPLYYGFVWFWTTPKLAAPRIAYYLILASFVFELIFVLVPARGKLFKVHAAATALVGIFMTALPVVYLIAGENLLNAHRAAIFGYLIISAAMLFVLLKKRHDAPILQVEVVFIASFLVMVSLLAHVG